MFLCCLIILFRSLSSEARDESVKSIWNYTLNECKGDIQIVTGDFNAEPHESSYGCLTGRCDEETTLEDFCPCKSNQNPYQDVWLHSQKESRGYRLDSKNHQRYFAEDGKNKFSQVERDGYTYPPCNPEKRIDYIMVRNTTTPLTEKPKSWSSQIISSYLVGKEVTPETGTLHLLSLISQLFTDFIVLYVYSLLFIYSFIDLFIE